MRDCPQRGNRDELVSWVVQGGLPRVSHSILAAVIYSGAVEEIKERNRQRIVDACSEVEKENI